MVDMIDDDADSALITLFDSLTRLRGRLSSAFAPARPHGLTMTELTVLVAVARAGHPPTVPQIGRSLGHPRQVIQRAASALVAAGLIETRPNPDHKRASLLVCTAAGQAVRAEADARGAAIARTLEDVVDPVIAKQATQLLDEMRVQLDQHARSVARRTN